MRRFSVPFFSVSLCVVLLLFSGLLYAQSSSPPPSAPSVDITLRMGQGGFQEDRSPLGRLGGGQATVDVYPRAWPVGVSIFTEYYTNSNDPTHSYEISNLVALNLLYTRPLFGINRVKYFLGAGAGWLEVPLGEDDPDEYISTDVYDLEAGVSVLAFWKIGFYGVVKYLTAHRTMNGVDVIDFDKTAWLLGITFNFSL
ncbi:MAG: hypothetical protein KAR40_16715 [Candidatus Sabulitectum sp.]|nr:hypothetical protein [Candidatus Sabulitectum sp.]